MDYNKLFQSKMFKGIILCTAALITLLFVFKIGMFLGYQRANFSYRWSENYHRNFAGPRDGFFREFQREFNGKDFVESHGIIGQIIKIDISTDSTSSPQVSSGGQAASFIIKGRDNAEKVVVINDDTAIMRFYDKITIGDLKNNDYVVIVGEPNSSGQIEAKLVRIMPASLPPPPPPAASRDIFPNNKR